MNPRAVWVTGIGAVTASGVGAGALLDALQASRSAVRPLPQLDGLPGGLCPTPPRERATRHLERSAMLFVTAAEEAWRDAGLPDAVLDADRFAVIEGSSLGPLADILDALRSHVAAGENGALRPTGLVRFLTGAGGASVAHRYHLTGPVLHVSAGSVSAACAIGEGLQKIAAGVADVVIVGGGECPLQQDVVGHFRAAGILADANGDDGACRPFDARRRGTVLGEGAGALVLEAADHATRRGARPRAVVSGFGLACEAFSMIAPDPSGAGVVTAARSALGELPPDEIDWIKAHGTGTKANDAAESCGIATVFGRRLETAPLTSLKPLLGHSLGASGAVETVAVILAMAHGFIPATVGTECVDPSLPACRVATRVERCDPQHVLLLWESFGGRCAALTLSQPDEPAQVASILRPGNEQGLRHLSVA
jgi:3-oxoacyl-(acyl-carrier-protein) synthase